MPTEMADPIIREIDIEAAPETVFEFFTDPAKLTRWLAVEATLDPRPGGVCHQVHEGAGPEHRRFSLGGGGVAGGGPERGGLTRGVRGAHAGGAPAGPPPQGTPA